MCNIFLTYCFQQTAWKESASPDLHASPLFQSSYLSGFVKGRGRVAIQLRYRWLICSRAQIRNFKKQNKSFSPGANAKQEALQVAVFLSMGKKKAEGDKLSWSLTFVQRQLSSESGWAEKTASVLLQLFLVCVLVVVDIEINWEVIHFDSCCCRNKKNTLKKETTAWAIQGDRLSF